MRLPGKYVNFFILLVGLAGCTPENPQGSHGTGAVRVGQVLGGSEDDDHFDRAEVVREFVFPKDHGTHPTYRTEWWYLTANLLSDKGEEFGVQYTLFRHALSPSPLGASKWQSGQVFMAHIALTDVDRGIHRHDQRLSRGHQGMAGVTIVPSFKAFLEDWVLEGDVEDQVKLSLKASSGSRFGMDLELMQTQPFLYQGNQGLSAKGPGQASYYYSIPSMSVSGEVMMDNRVSRVTGKAWLDREWSTSVLNDAQQGWDWFSLHFDDDSEVTLFNLRRIDCSQDRFNQALRLSADGERRDYDAREFTIRPLEFWVDSTGTSWPVSWSLEFPGEAFELKALVNDQIMDTGIRYWEGAIGVYQDSKRLGSGYMELTGYEGEPQCSE